MLFKLVIIAAAIMGGFHFDQLRRNELGVKPTFGLVSADPKTVLMPLPEWGFDPTEAAVSWKTLTQLGHRVVFATPNGIPSDGCDPIALTGILGGTVMKINPEPEAFYNEMLRSPEYLSPLAYSAVDPSKSDGLLIPGGHAEGMNTMLRNTVILEKVSQFASVRKPIAAICHGLLALTRAKDPETGQSVLRGRKVTGLPYYLEFQAYLLTHYLERLPADTYQLSTTWPRYVEDEVREAVGCPSWGGKYDSGPVDIVAPFLPGTNNYTDHTFVVEDRNLVTARFWGDTYIFAQRFAKLLSEA